MPKLTIAKLQHSAGHHLVSSVPVVCLDGLQLDSDLRALQGCRYLAFLSARYNMLCGLTGLHSLRCLWIIDLR